ncbi:glycerol 3-phosphate dehydrogenase-like isoform X2 [Mya arenaria]|uniref:glycerol 3-phosphate dehydrogenase-like isoform X2 n=1 Tax=Mya arenaria TaxID=6604 RepID=UPI0022E0D17C|nr:glycerol 3-phosphate dehydrogenase-like isoform X2 [Mya arenaria]
MDTYDVIVIGGGVTGCACLFELASCGYSCLLLEKNDHLLDEASSGNSGMLHTGFDAVEPLESDCIRVCQKRVFPLARKIGVPVNHIGATMVAWSQQQLQNFDKVKDNSRQVDCSEVRELSVSELYARESRLGPGALGALHIPGEAVTDPWLLPILLANDARKKGARLVCWSRVESLSRDGNKWTVDSTSGKYRGRCVINCGGLYGDILEGLACGQAFRILPRKGQYTVYSAAACSIIKSSILPVPTSAGKGVIVFRSVYDNVVVGPTNEYVQSRERAPINTDVTRRLAEVARSVVPDLTSHPIVTMYTGVRPATKDKDYIIHGDREKRWVGSDLLDCRAVSASQSAWPTL